MSLIVKTTSAFVDTALPKLYRDALINAGSLCLFDFANPFCFAKQAAPIATDTFVNLVDGAPGAVAANSGLAFSGGGVNFPGYTGPSSPYLDLGSNYNLSALGSPDFLMIAWVKQDVSFSASGNQGVFGRSINYNAGNAQAHIELNNGAGGRIGNAAASINPVVAAPAPISMPTQIAMAWVGGVASIYKNGVYGTSQAIAGPLANPAINARIGCVMEPFKGWVYRAYLENLTVSGESAATQVLADYNANVGRFS